MRDVQFISELILVVLEGKIVGSDQDAIDDLYAKYDEPAETVPVLDTDDFDRRFAKTRSYLARMNSDETVSRYARGFGDFYVLWALVALSEPEALPDSQELARRYSAFMENVELIGKQQDSKTLLQDKEGYARLWTYYDNSRGASTDLNPRTERLESLKASILDAFADVD